MWRIFHCQLLNQGITLLVLSGSTQTRWKCFIITVSWHTFPGSSFLINFRNTWKRDSLQPCWHHFLTMKTNRIVQWTGFEFSLIFLGFPWVTEKAKSKVKKGTDSLLGRKNISLWNNLIQDHSYQGASNRRILAQSVVYRFLWCILIWVIFD